MKNNTPRMTATKSALPFILSAIGFNVNNGKIENELGEQAVSIDGINMTIDNFGAVTSNPTVFHTNGLLTAIYLSEKIKTK